MSEHSTERREAGGSVDGAAAARPTTVADLQRKKQRGEKIVMVTAYDYPFARLADLSGIDIVLVGDSLGRAELGFPNELPVTMEIMLHHVQAVRRGIRRALLLADMPFLSYQVSVEEAIRALAPRADVPAAG